LKFLGDPCSGVYRVSKEMNAKENQQSAEAPKKSGYEAPRIVSYSAEELEKRIPKVSACESFNQNNDGQLDRLAPKQPQSY
jgi:hypothetical protein